MNYHANNIFQRILMLLVMFMAILISGCNNVGSAGPSEASVSGTKAITSFSLNGTFGTITGESITVVMPFGTDRTSLVASFTIIGHSVTANAVVQTSGLTSNDFTNPLIYTVTSKDGSTHDYTVTVGTSTYFVGYYPVGCTPNNDAMGIVGTCECIKDPNTNNIWYADGSKSGGWDDWDYGGGALADFNSTSHCGFTDSWNLPSAPNPSSGFISSTNPGGDWGDLVAASRGSGDSIGAWMSSNGFKGISLHRFYWSDHYYDNKGVTWGVNMIFGTVAYAPLYTDGGVLLVHSGA